MTANSQASKSAESAQTSKPAFTISIPSKENKQASQLRDALRIIAWTQFKVEYTGNLKGLKLYQIVFEPEWLKHEVHSKNFQELMELITSLGYTVSEVLNLRNKYYANGRANNRNVGVSLPEAYRNQFPEESDFSDDIGF